LYGANAGRLGFTAIAYGNFALERQFDICRKSEFHEFRRPLQEIFLVA
jgi:hypothetical protein